MIQLIYGLSLAIISNDLFLNKKTKLLSIRSLLYRRESHFFVTCMLQYMYSNQSNKIQYQQMEFACTKY